MKTAREMELEREVSRLCQELDAWERKGRSLENQARQLLQRADNLEKAFEAELEVVRSQAFRKAFETVLHHHDVPDHSQAEIKAELGIA